MINHGLSRLEFIRKGSKNNKHLVRTPKSSKHIERDYYNSCGKWHHFVRKYF